MSCDSVFAPEVPRCSRLTPVIQSCPLLADSRDMAESLAAQGFVGAQGFGHGSDTVGSFNTIRNSVPEPLVLHCALRASV